MKYLVAAIIGAGVFGMAFQRVIPAIFPSISRETADGLGYLPGAMVGVLGLQSILHKRGMAQPVKRGTVFVLLSLIALIDASSVMSRRWPKSSPHNDVVNMTELNRQVAAPKEIDEAKRRTRYISIGAVDLTPMQITFGKMRLLLGKATVESDPTQIGADEASWRPDASGGVYVTAQFQAARGGLSDAARPITITIRKDASYYREQFRGSLFGAHIGDKADLLQKQCKAYGDKPSQDVPRCWSANISDDWWISWDLDANGDIEEISVKDRNVAIVPN